jgi:hypothetical protein
MGRRKKTRVAAKFDLEGGSDVEGQMTRYIPRVEEKQTFIQGDVIASSSSVTG